MSYTDERTGLEVITLTECVRYLQGAEIARVAYVVDGSVHMYPVNYAWDGEAMVFRCEPDSHMARAAGREFVAEIDGIDARNRKGWSVIARGRADIVDPETSPRLADDLRTLALYPWANGDKELWLRMLPAPLTGRRVERTRVE